MKLTAASLLKCESNINFLSVFLLGAAGKTQSWTAAARVFTRGKKMAKIKKWKALHYQRLLKMSNQNLFSAKNTEASSRVACCPLAEFNSHDKNPFVVTVVVALGLKCCHNIKSQWHNLKWSPEYTFLFYFCLR